jgi:hypothetical protein
MTNWILIIVIVVAVLAIVALKKTKKKPATVFPYQSREKLFSEAERSFLGVLDKIVGDKFRVFAKVRLADLLKVGGGVSSSERQSAFNRISRKHVDFLITRKDDLSFVGIIELDDKSHRKQKRQERDEFIDKAFGAAGIPICHIKAQSGYSGENVSGTISDAFKVELNSPSQKTEPPSKTSGKESINEEIQACPKCGGELVKRVAKKGKNTGQKFWGCANFPKCRFVKKRQ